MTASRTASSSMRQLPPARPSAVPCGMSARMHRVKAARAGSPGRTSRSRSVASSVLRGYGGSRQNRRSDHPHLRLWPSWRRQSAFQSGGTNGNSEFDSKDQLYELIEEHVAKYNGSISANTGSARQRAQLAKVKAPEFWMMRAIKASITRRT